MYLLQNGANFITKRDNLFITNRGKNLLQIRAAFSLHIGVGLLQLGAAITNRGRYYILGQLLQIGA